MVLQEYLFNVESFHKLIFRHPQNFFRVYLTWLFVKTNCFIKKHTLVTIFA